MEEKFKNRDNLQKIPELVLSVYGNSRDKDWGEVGREEDGQEKRFL